LRFTEKGLNVQKVRLTLSRLARLAYEAFYESVDNFFKVSEVAIYKEYGKIQTCYEIVKY
jgi:hypothetical protein